VFGIAVGYEDLNDHDELLHDSMMAILTGKLTVMTILTGKLTVPVPTRGCLSKIEHC
jgi:hypothetical protein